MITDNYYHRQGITIKKVKEVCKQLGLSPAYWSHIKTAIGILETDKAIKL